MLTEEEKRQLTQWNDTRRDYPKDKTIHQIFETQVAHGPERVAVVCWRKTVNLSGIERARKSAGPLLEENVASVPRCWWAFASSDRWKWSSRCWVFLRPAAAYLPLDPDYPIERLALCSRMPGCRS